jgi:uncharacterized membrane protein YagU involved in acid resistance
MQRDLVAVIDGGISGCIATVVMSGEMMGARKMGMMGAQPPERLSERLLHTAGIHHKKKTAQDLLAAVLHLGFGTTMGALYAVLHRRLPMRTLAPLQGILFGTAVWAISYKGWIPALGIMPPPEHDRPGRPQAMVLAHWVYGGTLGKAVAVAADLRRRSGSPGQADRES